MNIARSITIATFEKKMTKKELAEKMGVTSSAMTALFKGEACSGRMIKRVSEALDLKASEFIALGE